MPTAGLATTAETDAPFVAPRIEAPPPPIRAIEIAPDVHPSRWPGRSSVAPVIAEPALKRALAPEPKGMAPTPRHVVIASESKAAPDAKADQPGASGPREQQAASPAPLLAPAAAVTKPPSSPRDIEASPAVASSSTPAPATEAPPAPARLAPPLLRPSAPTPEPAPPPAPRAEPAVHIGAIEVRVSPQPQPQPPPPSPPPAAPSWFAPPRPPLPAPGYGWRYGRAQS